MNGISAGTQIVYVNTWWQNLIVGIKYAFGALTVSFGSTLSCKSVKRTERKRSKQL